MRSLRLWVGGVALLAAPAWLWATPAYIPYQVSISATALSPDGRFLAVGYQVSGTSIPPGEENRPLLRVWSIASGKEVRSFKGHTGGVDGLAFTRDGRRLVARSGGTISVWDLQAAKHVRSFDPKPENGFGTGLSPDGKLLLAWIGPGRTLPQPRLQLFDLNTGELRKTVDGVRSHASPILASPDNRLAYVGGILVDLEAGIVLRSFAKTLQELRTAPREWVWVGPVAFSPDSKYLALEKEDINTNTRVVKLYTVFWDVRRDEEAFRIRKRVWQYREGGRRPAWAGPAPTTPAPVRKDLPQKPPEGGAEWFAFTPDGKRLLIAESDGKLRLWDVRRDTELWAVSAGRVEHPTFVEAGRQVLLLATSVTLPPERRHLRFQYHDLSDGKLVRELTPNAPQP